jgi:hypothetical protein
MELGAKIREIISFGLRIPYFTTQLHWELDWTSSQTSNSSLTSILMMLFPWHLTLLIKSLQQDNLDLNQLSTFGTRKT